MKLFNYGSINIDHIYRVPHLVQPGETLSSYGYQKLLGGKGANQSIALARAGSDVTHLGRLHSTDAGMLEPMRQAGVNLDQIQITDVASGHAIIQVDDAAENAIVLYTGANHSFGSGEVSDILNEAVPGDWLLLQNECSCTAEVIGQAVAKGVQVAFNPAPMDDTIKALPLSKLSLLFVNQVEVLQLLGADSHLEPDSEWLSAQLQEYLPDTKVVVTLGAEGAYYYYQGKSVFAAAEKVEAVDTTGAGDTFIGYFIAAMLNDLPVIECLQRAGKAAALCVQTSGASVSIPVSTEVDAFVSTTE